MKLTAELQIVRGIVESVTEDNATLSNIVAQIDKSSINIDGVKASGVQFSGSSSEGFIIIPTLTVIRGERLPYVLQNAIDERRKQNAQNTR